MTSSSIFVHKLSSCPSAFAVCVCTGLPCLDVINDFKLKIFQPHQLITLHSFFCDFVLISTCFKLKSTGPLCGVIWVNRKSKHDVRGRLNTCECASLKSGQEAGCSSHTVFSHSASHSGWKAHMPIRITQLKLSNPALCQWCRVRSLLPFFQTCLGQIQRQNILEPHTIFHLEIICQLNA